MAHLSMAKQSNRKLVDALARIGREYRHYQQEHARESLDGATRHAMERRMHRLGARFEQFLSHWIQDPPLHDAWMRYLREGAPAPDEPLLGTPPVFKGVARSGARVEIRPSEDGRYDLIVDGSIERHEAVPWELAPDMIEPIQIGEHTCNEVHDVPPEVLKALAGSMARAGAEPPWQWVRGLFEDGLIDETFGLTARGFRVLGKAAPRPAGAPPPITFGILAADAARARLFVLQPTDGEYAPTVEPLLELLETTNPEQRTRDSDLFADTRPGLRREGPHGPRHGVSDRRDRHRRDAERRFASLILKEAVRVWQSHAVTRVVLVASPAMLGMLRRAMEHAPGGRPPWSIRELARGLTRLAAPALHDVLASDGLLPPRGRLPPLHPPPGAPL
jgi:protein required for attachment to host cells